VLITAL